MDSVQEARDWLAEQDTQAQEIIREGGIDALDAYNQGQQEQFELDNVQLPSGEWVDRDYLDGLSKGR